jgi:DNA-binding winged helix-turn-helix (wHTH) protein
MALCRADGGVPFQGASRSRLVRMDGDSLGTRGFVSFGPFCLFSAERQLKKGDEPLQLGGRALDTLIALVERAGEVVTQRELISRVWPDVTVEEANLRVHIANLRKALGDGYEGARYIVTVPGRGYSFVAPVDAVFRRRDWRLSPIGRKGCHPS